MTLLHLQIGKPAFDEGFAIIVTIFGCSILVSGRRGVFVGAYCDWWGKYGASWTVYNGQSNA